MVRIYLPASYSANPRAHFPVLYLHDGQNVFSSAGPDACAGWGNWELNLTVDTLSSSGMMQEIIMVSVDNSPDRLEEYSGRRRGRGGVRAPFENYEAFLVRELKPWLDQRYRTEAGAVTTSLMGSSMGGVCSLVLAWDNPDVFGGAASLSGAFSPEHTPLLEMLRVYHGRPKPVRFYLDSGVTSGGGDDGRACTGDIIAQLRRIGWTKDNLEWFVDENLVDSEALEKSGLRRDKWAEAQVSQHNEFYWRQRSWRPLRFLFPASKRPGGGQNES